MTHRCCAESSFERWAAPGTLRSEFARYLITGAQTNDLTSCGSMANGPGAVRSFSLIDAVAVRRCVLEHTKCGAAPCF